MLVRVEMSSARVNVFFRAQLSRIISPTLSGKCNLSLLEDHLEIEWGMFCSSTTRTFTLKQRMPQKLVDRDLCGYCTAGAEHLPAQTHKSGLPLYRESQTHSTASILRKCVWKCLCPHS